MKVKINITIEDDLDEEKINDKESLMEYLQGFSGCEWGGIIDDADIKIEKIKD